jgi:hypothetical protein
LCGIHIDESLQINAGKAWQFLKTGGVRQTSL